MKTCEWQGMVEDQNVIYATGHASNDQQPCSGRISSVNSEHIEPHNFESFALAASMLALWAERMRSKPYQRTWPKDPEPNSQGLPSSSRQMVISLGSISCVPCTTDSPFVTHCAAYPSTCSKGQAVRWHHIAQRTSGQDLRDVLTLSMDP